MERNTAGNRTEQEIKTVTFNVQDRMTYGVLGYDRSELMAVISGGDLEIRFNMRLINSLADAEACADALAQVFYDTLIEQLIQVKVGFIKPSGKDGTHPSPDGIPNIDVKYP